MPNNNGKVDIVAKYGIQTVLLVFTAIIGIAVYLYGSHEKKDWIKGSGVAVAIIGLMVGLGSILHSHFSIPAVPPPVNGTTDPIGEDDIVPTL